MQRGSLPQDLAELAETAGRSVHNFSDMNEDLPTALALLSLLDDYVAVSNTNVHLKRRARQAKPRPRHDAG